MSYVCYNSEFWKIDEQKFRKENLERILTIIITFTLVIYSLLLGFSKNHVSFAGRISGSPLDDGQSADSSFQCRAASSSPAPIPEAALDSCPLPSLVHGSAANSVKGFCIHSLFSAHVQAKQQQAVKGSFASYFVFHSFFRTWWSENLNDRNRAS